MTYLGTLFNHNYLNRGLTLIESLNRHYKGYFHLFILCLDQETYDYFKSENHKFVQLILIDEVESFYPELIIAKGNRSLVEYYFTLSPVLPLYILETYKISQITTIDADIFFFSNPEPLFKEIEKYSISILPHNFSEGLMYKEIYGKYNVSFQSFKNNKEGLQCLRKWKGQCLEWCYDILEDNRFADQKYLNNWPDLYNDLLEIKSVGTGVAPWNINSFIIKFYKNQLYINSNKLIFYHFHGLRIIGQNLILHGLADYRVRINKMITRYIYKPYIKSLLSYKLNKDSEIKRYRINSQSILETILFQKDWFYYNSGVLLKRNKFIDLLSVIAEFIKNQRAKWRN